jgi:hypothetical protein
MMRRNMEDVIWLILVVVKYILHMIFPNGQYSRTVVTIKNGIPTRKHSSAMARLTMYKFVTEI